MTTQNSGASSDIAASLVLLGAAILALVAANSPLSGFYQTALATPISVSVGDLVLSDTTKNWIKNALMAVFFLYVGLEIKAEFMQGALADRERATLPFVAAFGGLVVPAAIYLKVVGFDPALANGWAIPAATDIAFAVGVVGLLGARVPPALKVFLLAVAIIDDMAAILIIAAFYTEQILPGPLLYAGLCLCGLLALNLANVARLSPYMLLGAALWLAVLKSGINPTLAGVATALFVPLRVGDDHLLYRLVKALKNTVLFAIMPIFALANAGVALGGVGLADVLNPVTMGIALGLLVGKPVGITAAVWVARAAGLARLPEGATWMQVIGVGFLAGIGFTMSLFIGALAFTDEAMMNAVRMGVLLGSALTAAAGAAILAAAAHRLSAAAVTRAS